MQFDQKVEIHLLSLRFAKCAHDVAMKASAGTESPQYKDAFKTYQGLRRLLPKEENGKRYGSGEAYQMIRHGMIQNENTFTIFVARENPKGV